MKKLTIVFVVLFGVLTLVGCSKKTVEVIDSPADLSVWSGLSVGTQWASLE